MPWLTRLRRAGEQFGEDFLRALNYFVRHAGELRDFDSVAVIGTAFDYFAQKCYVISTLFGGYVVIYNARDFTFQLA